MCERAFGAPKNVTIGRSAALQLAPPRGLILYILLRGGLHMSPIFFVAGCLHTPKLCPEAGGRPARLEQGIQRVGPEGGEEVASLLVLIVDPGHAFSYHVLLQGQSVDGMRQQRHVHVLPWRIDDGASRSYIPAQRRREPGASRGLSAGEPRKRMPMSTPVHMAI